jgi:hypothetical protein
MRCVLSALLLLLAVAHSARVNYAHLAWRPSLYARGSYYRNVLGNIACPSCLGGDRKVVVAPGQLDIPGAARFDADASYNYVNFNAANRANFGLTGLVSVVQIGANPPGTFFMFPGTQVDAKWVGTFPKINGLNMPPIRLTDLPPGSTLHGRMCALLGQPATSFVGFSVNPQGNRNLVGYNSATCNIYHFQNRMMSDLWKLYVKSAVATTGVPAEDR